MTSLSCSLESSPRVGVKTFIGAEWGGGGGGGGMGMGYGLGRGMGPRHKAQHPLFFIKIAKF